MPRSDFMEAWNNIIFAVIGEDFDTHTVLLDPSQPLTAHRLTDVFSRYPSSNYWILGSAMQRVF
ncbi:hypothetical protein HSBAA_27610 [Vreelandella sulfidaeris]|uniref:Uncharacterized protein n=1 Tax=Vreelandella sulfidaeris TaxID=115553 RepID=A0A455U660_9GAMM|nr:hypothetical protein HSBAA_27610 [Halomonas sulfidaeris]